MRDRNVDIWIDMGIAVAFIFSTILFYFILFYFDKLPGGWGYFHIFGIVLLVFLSGILIRLWLEGEVLK